MGRSRPRLPDLRRDHAAPRGRTGVQRPQHEPRSLPWNAPIPAEERARIRTAVATAAFAREHGRPPRDDAELTGFLAAASRPAQVPVAGYDLTFSPVKSVSALWSLAPPEVAGQVEAAHAAAVRSTLAMLEREVAFTRVGKGGIRQVPVTGLVAAAFDHRDSRAGDPDLHTHLVVSNKVQALAGEGGKWLTLDGRMLFKAKVMASEHYNTRLEAELTDRLGVRFVERPGPQGRRPVREIDGLDPRLLEAWSSRRRDITDRQRALAETFQADHGRAPTRIESLALAQQANLETRPDKHEPRSLRDQRKKWRAEAEAMLAEPGRPGASAVAHMLAGVLGRGRQHVVHRGGYEGGNDISTRVLAVLEASRSTWQVWHVRAEALRQARYAGVPLADVDETVRVVTERVTQQLSVFVTETRDLGEPEILRREDGESVYTVHGSRTYTSTGVFDAERRLLESAERTDGHAVQDIFVQLAIGRATENGTPLDPGQADLVSRLATSGARVQVALALAGSGKTTAMATLAKAWRAGGGDVVGLAPTAVAAAELGASMDTPAETVAKFLHTTSLAADDSRVPAFPPVGPRTLLVVDETGMVGTTDLAAVVDHALTRGGSVRLVGDDQQLTAVAASGVFRDLADLGGRTGTTVRLTELHRFTDPAEATATLGVRNGDPDALEHYLTHGRVHVGDAGTAADYAYDAWRADIAAERTSLLLAASRDVVRDLNEQARADRLADQHPTREVRLADGTHASTGDPVVTRHNDRSLRTRSGAWVKNGDRWVVLSVESRRRSARRARRSTRGRPRDRGPPGQVRRAAPPARVRRHHPRCPGRHRRHHPHRPHRHRESAEPLRRALPRTPPEPPLPRRQRDSGGRGRRSRRPARRRSASRRPHPHPRPRRPRRVRHPCRHPRSAPRTRELDPAVRGRPPAPRATRSRRRADACPRRGARTMDARPHHQPRIPGSARPDRDQVGRRRLPERGPEASHLVAAEGRTCPRGRPRGRNRPQRCAHKPWDERRGADVVVAACATFAAQPRVGGRLPRASRGPDQ